MARPTAHEALIYIMVIISASDRDMTDVELEKIGVVVRTWPIFEDFNDERLIGIAQKCQKLLGAEGGFHGLLPAIAGAIPRHLHDTAYSLACEIAVADLEMRMEERRILQVIQGHLAVDAPTVAAIERATKARHRMLT